MSLEVTLIPIALVVINVLDRNYYDSWIKKKRIKKETQYGGIDEFLRDLNEMDYTYDVQQTTVRICGKHEGTRYYFSNDNGRWILSFSEYDSRNDVADFIKKLASISNGKITPEVPAFEESKSKKVVVNSPSVNKMPALADRSVNFYPTIYNDHDLLVTVLKNLGVDCVENNEEIEFVKDSTKCTFIKDENGQYILRTVGNITDEVLFRTIQDLDIVYLRDVQKKTYESVISKLNEQNMKLESEVRLEDDTIVLTLNVE